MMKTPLWIVSSMRLQVRIFGSSYGIDSGVTACYQILDRNVLLVSSRLGRL